MSVSDLDRRPAVIVVDAGGRRSTGVGRVLVVQQLATILIGGFVAKPIGAAGGDTVSCSVEGMERYRRRYRCVELVSPRSRAIPRPAASRHATQCGQPFGHSGRSFMDIQCVSNR